MKYIYENDDIQAGMLFSDGSPKMIVRKADKTVTRQDEAEYAILDLQTGLITTPFVNTEVMRISLNNIAVRPLSNGQVFNEEEY
jgi:hypothetical protein